MPNELCPELRNRMPVILNHRALLVWFREAPAETALLTPCASDEMYTGRSACGSAGIKTNDPSLIAPIAAVG